MLRQRSWLARCQTFSTIWQPHHSRTPSAVVLNTQGWEKLEIFVQFLTEIYRLSRKRCEISHWYQSEWYHFRWPWV